MQPLKMKLPLEMAAVFIVGLLFGYAVGYVTLPKPPSTHPTLTTPTPTPPPSPSPNLQGLKKSIENFYRSILRMNGLSGDVKIKNYERKNFYRFTVEINAGGRIQEVHVVADEKGDYLYPVEVPMKAPTREFKEPPKSERPRVELFVMSYCPYGIQMEKGFIPVLRLLGKKIDFELKFVSYAMHGEKEVWENLRQYCIQKLYPNKLVDYLECFDIRKPQDWRGCLEEVGIDVQEINNCMTEADEEYNISKILSNESSWGGRFPPFPLYEADNRKYSVRGSPTLVINGTVVWTGRSPEAIKEAICSAFKSPPPECNQKLSEETPSPGFGGGTGSQTSQAQCG